MSIWKFLNPLANLTEKIGDAIDKNITSDEERIELKNEVEFLLSKEKLALEGEATKRLELDMSSDNNQAKIIRPTLAKWGFVGGMSLIFIAIIASLLQVEINENLIEYGLYFCATPISIYFPARTVDKIITLRRKF